MRKGRMRTIAALIAGGLLMGGLSGGLALAAGKKGSSMHHGHAMHHSSSMRHGSSMSHDSGMPEQGPAMSHGAAMESATFTG